MEKLPLENQSSEKEDVILNYEDFLSKMNNFYCHFHPAPDYDFYKTAAHYKKFADENPELEKNLREEMKKLVSAKEQNPVPQEDSPYFKAQGKGYGTIFSEMTDLPIMPLLYEAYKKMRPHVENDQKLFQ